MNESIRGMINQLNSQVDEFVKNVMTKKGGNYYG